MRLAITDCKVVQWGENTCLADADFLSLLDTWPRGHLVARRMVLGHNRTVRMSSLFAHVKANRTRALHKGIKNLYKMFYK